MSMPETRNWPRRKTNSCEPMSERLLPWTMTDTSGLSKQRSDAGGSSRRTSTRPSMGLGRISGAGRCRIRMSFRAARISSLMDRAEDAHEDLRFGLPVQCNQKTAGREDAASGVRGQTARLCKSAGGDVFPQPQEGSVFALLTGQARGAVAVHGAVRPRLPGSVAAPPGDTARA